MAAQCTVSGPWNNVKQAVAPSVNEFQTESLAILTQIVNSLAGTSLQIPTSIPSDNEYRAGALAALCVIAQSIGGSSGAGNGYLLEYANQASLPAAPADVNKVWLARFRDGSAGMTWSVVLQAWF